jgi:hypothetical protein
MTKKGNTSMRSLSRSSGVVVLAACIASFCRIGSAQEETTSLMDTARNELRATGLSDKEVAIRVKIVENVATLKAYYPHADGGRPEYRNPKHWKLNHDGSYIPVGKPSEAICDLWQTESGIRCAKLSALVMLKAVIDVADAKRRAELDTMLQDKVIPNELPKKGMGTFFAKPTPKHGTIFETAELLPGDEVWFENPYFDRLSGSLKRRYIGQEGHHVFYIGDGKVMDMYSREPSSVEDFRKTFVRWKSVRIVAKRENRKPKAEEFQIKAVRRVIVTQD